MKWPINRKKADEVIEVLPSDNESYVKPAREILDAVHRGEIKAEEGEALVVAIVSPDGQLRLEGYGNKEQVVTVAINLILKAAGIEPKAVEKVE